MSICPFFHISKFNKFSDIIQWNCRGIKNKKHELEILVAECKAQVFCLQETKLSHDDQINLRGYDFFYKHKQLAPDEKAHGGVAILASQKCSKHEIALNTPLQAVAISIKLNKRITICSFYCPPGRNANFSKADLEALIGQLPKPFLILGDFNAYNNLWHAKKTDARGSIIEDILIENDIYFLDQNKDTHFYTDQGVIKSSHIDLSLCSTNLLLEFEWGLFDQTMDSDHYPIWIRSGRKRRPISFPKWVIDKANWPKFTQNTIPTSSVKDFQSVHEANEYCKTFIKDAATKAIPKTSGNEKNYNSPWWNEECKKVKENRKIAWEKFLNEEITQIEWNRAKAKARQVFNWSKKKSWLQFMESINEKTTSKEVWRKISILTKKYKPNVVNTLKVDGQIIDDPKDIADKIGESFEQISSEANCSQAFIRHKRANTKKLNFNTKENLDYNFPISKKELEAAINDLSNTATGPDEIHNSMLKNLSDEGKNYLLELLNYIFSEGVLPENWKLAYIIPILKQGKDPMDVKSYRPISLTSCLCKLFERILNKRLVWFLETNNCIHKSQNGFRKGRSTLDNLVALETEIHDAFVENKLLVSIFFDLEKAYDTCWSQLILNELHKFGLRGKLPLIISDYLKDRKFQVRVNNKLSKFFRQEMGVPQGGILSVTLFVIAMNTVVDYINNELTYSIYVDDLRISYLASTLKCAQRILNLQLKNLKIWMDRTGFNFSELKTKAVIFHRGNKKLKDRELQLNFGNSRIEVVSEVKLLGIIFDDKLTWIPHLETLKRKCITSLNAMKLMVKHSKTVDTNFLLRIYKSLVRSKLDYGCQVYGTAGASRLEKLDPVHHAALRLCTGAYRTTNKESLYVEARESSLKNRRLFLDLQYFFRSQRIPEEKKILSWEDATLDPIYVERSNPYFKPKSFGFKTRQVIQELNIQSPTITKIRFYKSPPWSFQKFEVCFHLTKFIKIETAPEIFKQEFENHRHISDIEIFTDGSKNLEKVGSGLVIKKGESVQRIPLRIHDHSSVFVAELFAIRAGIFHIKKLKNLSCSIYSDSKSALQAIDKFHSDNSLVQTIQENINHCRNRNINILLCWVPGHVGIKGNEEADEMAKSALNLKTITLTNIFASDFKQVLKNKIIEKWQSEWDKLVENNRTPLSEIQRYVNYANKLIGLNRLENVKLTRLRTGHTKFSKQYIVKNEPAPECIECEKVITVKHILVECGNYYHERKRFLGNSNLNIKDLLSSNDLGTIRNILQFFKEIGLYTYI